MSDHNIKCPLCGMNRMRPRPHVPSTPWSDECGCDDGGPCMHHRLSDDPMPERPSEEVMQQRAEARCALRLKQWEAWRAAFEEYERRGR